jgi:hypothetical protein
MHLKGIQQESSKGGRVIARASNEQFVNVRTMFAQTEGPGEAVRLFAFVFAVFARTVRTNVRAN